MSWRIVSLRTIVTVLAAVTIGALGVASASSLGGIVPKSITSVNASSSAGTPTVLSCDDFSRAAATGTALVSRPVQLPATCGAATWTVHLGTWTITSGQLGAATANATATVSAGQTNASAQATVLNMNGASRAAGVAIDHTGSTRTFLAAVMSGPSTLNLQLSTSGTMSTLATASVTFAASNVLRITRNGSAVTVSIDGTQKIAFTLTAGQISTLSSGTRAGLYWSSGSTVKFTNFLLTTAYAP